MSRICNAIRPWDNPIEIFAVETHQELKGNGETWIVPPAPRDLVRENGVPWRRSVAPPHGPPLSSFSGFITHHAFRISLPVGLRVGRGLLSLRNAIDQLP